MANARLVIALSLAAVVGMVLFVPLVDVVNGSTGDQTITNETVTAQSGEYVDLEGYSIEDGSETVYGFNDTSGSYEVASEGADYELALENGSLKALSGSSLIDDGEDVKVTYTYESTGSTTTLVSGFLPVMVAVLVFARLATGAQDMM